MKYKRGSIVEVLTKDEAPYHSWRCAQIVSGNRHDYSVRYDVYPGFSDNENVERVSTESVRPRPPPMDFAECWIPGDVVEVFHNLSWKMAVVSKALGWDQFVVRLVGSFQEFEVSKSELRVRQSWQNDKWIVIGEMQVPTYNEDGRHNKIVKHNLNSDSQDKRRGAEKNLYMKDLGFGAQNKNNLQDSRFVSSRTLKRGSPCCYSRGEANKGTAKKLKVDEKEGRRLRLLLTSPENVDASFDNRATQIYEADVEGNNPHAVFGCARGLSLEPNEADNAASSVGSCSINSYKPYEMQCVSDIEGHDSDAESVCQVGYREGIDLTPSHKELMAKIHSLELHAYRCTMEALHASGPLSWEKETMAESRQSLHSIGMTQWGIS